MAEKERLKDISYQISSYYLLLNPIRSNETLAALP